MLSVEFGIEDSLKTVHNEQQGKSAFEPESYIFLAVFLPNCFLHNNGRPETRPT